ncbi:MAG: YigZ family protein [Ardenticatenales bacterium]
MATHLIPDPYPIPSERTEATTSAGNSTFVAIAQRIESVEEARAVVADRRRERPDATHHCYAFAVGHGASVTHGSSDDGEPSGTAGRPILAVVAGSGLGDVIVVVTRYFGGTKLGTGGLVRAYTDAAKAVLEACPRRLKIARLRLVGHATYPLYDLVHRIAVAAGADVLGADFNADVRVTVEVDADKVLALQAAVAEATAGVVSFAAIDDL